MWSNVVDIMPAAMANCLNELMNCEKLKFILSGLNGASYVIEWENIYGAIVEFVYAMYRARQVLNIQ